MYEAVKTLIPNAAFALFTGDIVDHAIWVCDSDTSPFQYTPFQNGESFHEK